MPLFSTRAVSLRGIDGAMVEVEADLANGLPAFTLVGLPDASLSESRDRVRAAVVNSGHPWPARRLTVNLSPAGLPKHGTGFDLAIAAAVLGCHGLFTESQLRDTALIGELGLDGRLRPVRGVLPSVAAAARAQVGRVIVPEANVAEAMLVPGVEVFGIRSLRQLVALARNEPLPDEPLPAELSEAAPVTGEAKDLRDVRGQPAARWALEIAAAGGHHVLMVGPPGAGKTMLAERLPTLLPDLPPAEALDVTALHSLAGLLSPGGPLVTRPPWQQPHHTASVAAMVGGGSGTIRPGAASLAHRGVLFLDEAPEFRGAALQALREPLESGSLTVARASGAVTFPARMLLVLAANPCPCGQGIGKGLLCSCPALRKRQYFAKLSGPLLDRVDLRLVVTNPTPTAYLAQSTEESSAEVAGRVLEARQRARRRFDGEPWTCNGDVPASLLRGRWAPASGATEPLDQCLLRGSLSMRGADRVLRIAWTLADLAGRDRPDKSHVSAALALRSSEVAAA